MEKRPICMTCGSRIDQLPEPHDCIGELIPRPPSDGIGIALHDSIEDPETGEHLVTFLLT